MTNIDEQQICKLTANVKAGGCAAKLSSHELHEIVSGLEKLHCDNLLTGINNFEDAAVYKISDSQAIIQSVDFFPPLVDDPFLFGQIAATNALSDIYAMGGQPIFALNILSFPSCDLPLSAARKILEGGAQKIKQAQATLAGGHSIQGKETLYGLSVTGLVHPDKILTNDNAKAGDKIILTKSIGTGIGLLAMKGNVLSKQTIDVLIAGLTQLNDQCLKVALKHRVHAATDVTGFGLIGHLHEMAKGSGLKAKLQSKSVPLLPEVLDLAQQGFVPAATYANRKSFQPYVQASNINDEVMDLLFDAQTSGGLIFSIAADNAHALLSELKPITDARIIGEFQSADLKNKGLIEVVDRDA